MTPEQEELRNKLRAATLGSPAVRRSVVVQWAGLDFEVKKPSLSLATRIEKLSKQKDGTRDTLRSLLMALYEGIFLPGTDVKVYTPADADEMASRTDDDFVGVFMKAFGELNKDDNLEEVEKN